LALFFIIKEESKRLDLYFYMMEDLKTFASSIAQIAEEKDIPKEKILEIIEMAIAAAYKKDYGKKGERIMAKLDPQTGKVKFWQVKEVVDKSMVSLEEGKKEEKKEEPSEEKKVRFNPKRHILIEEAKKIDPKVKPGDELVFPLEAKEGYGRIAAQTAKQVILQRLKEAERQAIYDEYKTKEGEVVSGVVQRIEGENVFLDIGKTLGVLPKSEQIPRESYRPGQRLRAYIKKVEESPRGPRVILSRAYPKFVSKLFEIEVPEVSSSQVEIKAIAREPGSRTKIAVASNEKGIDPIGAMVGQRGTRVMAVMDGLGGEKIDIIEWKEKPEEFIANALSPAKILEVKIEPKNKAVAIVPEDQLSLAIGKDGQNVRLAAKLTGWKIDVKSQKTKSKNQEKQTKNNKQ
jgi:N utilization substance protein A